MTRPLPPCWRSPNETFRPDLFLARGDGLSSGGVPLLEERLLVGGRPAAYLCRGFACEAPATDPEGLRGLLAGGQRLEHAIIGAPPVGVSACKQARNRQLPSAY